MPGKSLEKTVRSLQRELRVLKAKVYGLREKRKGDETAELRGMLRRRGLELFRANPAQHLLFPATFPPEQTDRFYELFKKYSFRLFLREILNQNGGFRVAEAGRYSSVETGRKYLRSLLELGLVESIGELQYRFLAPSATSLGPTLEWFMAEIFRREFSCPALYGLRCKGTRFGGDYDVVAAMEGRLIYMEVKSSPPKNIEGDEIREFFSRLQDLQPHLAFFFVDTELRLKDKIVPIFEAEQKALASRKMESVSSAKIADEIFFLPPGIYMISSKRSIIRNMAVCFRHFFNGAGQFPHAAGRAD